MELLFSNPWFKSCSLVSKLILFNWYKNLKDLLGNLTIINPQPPTDELLISKIIVFYNIDPRSQRVSRPETFVSMPRHSGTILFQQKKFFSPICCQVKFFLCYLVQSLAANFIWEIPFLSTRWVRSFNSVHKLSSIEKKNLCIKYLSRAKIWAPPWAAWWEARMQLLCYAPPLC